MPTSVGGPADRLSGRQGRLNMTCAVDWALKKIPLSFADLGFWTALSARNVKEWHQAKLYKRLADLHSPRGQIFRSQRYLRIGLGTELARRVSGSSGLETGLCNTLR